MEHSCVKSGKYGHHTCTYFWHRNVQLWFFSKVSALIETSVRDFFFLNIPVASSDPDFFLIRLKCSEAETCGNDCIDFSAPVAFLYEFLTRLKHLAINHTCGFLMNN